MSNYVYVPPAPPCETETRFVEWLETASRGVEWKFMRWLTNRDGEVFETNNGGDFCEDCVIIQRYVNRHKSNGFTDIDGWDEHFPSDSPRWCERCDALLCHSLSEYGVGQEIAVLEDLDSVSPSHAAILYELLSGIGDYQREKHWPLIEPHAIRLMNQPATEKR